MVNNQSAQIGRFHKLYFLEITILHWLKENCFGKRNPNLPILRRPIQRRNPQRHHPSEMQVLRRQHHGPNILRRSNPTLYKPFEHSCCWFMQRLRPQLLRQLPLTGKSRERHTFPLSHMSCKTRRRENDASPLAGRFHVHHRDTLCLPCSDASRRHLRLAVVQFFGFALLHLGNLQDIHPTRCAYSKDHTRGGKTTRRADDCSC